MLTVLVTGVGGFVGRRLVPFLAGHGFSVIAMSRSVSGREQEKVSYDAGNAVALCSASPASTDVEFDALMREVEFVVHGKAGRRLVKDKFFLSKVIDQVLAVYERAMR